MKEEEKEKKNGGGRRYSRIRIEGRRNEERG